MRAWVILAAILTASCGAGNVPAENAQGENGQASPLALMAENDRPVTSLQPVELSESDRIELLRAFAASEKAAQVVRRKSETGFVVDNESAEFDLVQAVRDLERTQAALAEMSSPGLPTYLLLHRISKDRELRTWLIGAEGVIAFGSSPGRFAGLESLVDGLGVTRLAATRGRRDEGEPPQPHDAQRAAQAEDQSPKSRKQRELSLIKARETILPGRVGQALGRSAGRLLIVAAEDTGTAPYAALPLDNGFAAKNWSFVVMPDIKTLAGSDSTFDYRSIDLGKAVIVGDPDLSEDPLYDWDPLPGARREALSVAERLGVPEDSVLLGKQATQRAFRRAINRMSGEGLVYIAGHAVADPQNPLTRGFVAMTGEHYYAGYIRQEKFPDWKRQPPLVVVSACQTALGRVLDGGGFGVSQSWVEAGAGQVVGSLWNVSDKATLILMRHFTARLKAGDAPEIAMQRAQLETMIYKERNGNQPYIDDPKMWASFTIFGKPSRDPV